MASFDQIKKTLQYPDGVSSRFKTLDAYDRLLDGTLYDEMPHPFDVERKDGVRYIPLEERRPSVVYNLARIIADQCSVLTFGDGHSPHVRCWDDEGKENPYESTEEAIEALTEATDIDSAMMRSVYLGSVGSCAIIVRAKPDLTPHLSVVRGKYARPVLDPRDPSALEGLVQQYPVTGIELLQRGYSEEIVKNEDDIFWLRSELDARAEVWYQPLPNDKFQKIKDATSGVRWIRDTERSAEHRFGCVPAVWLRNGASDDVIDGQATFGPIVHFIIKMDYLLSQVARGIRFSADPLLVVKRGELLDLATADSPFGGSEIVKDPSSGIELHGKDADAKMLETTGKGVDAGIAFVKLIREYALEVVSGMRSDADKSTGAPQSGRALEILHQALLWLIQRIRLAYGDRGLVPLLRILIRGIKRGAIEIQDIDPAQINERAPIRLVWPKWNILSGADLQAEAQALQILAGGGKDNVPLLPRDTVTRMAAMEVGLTDPNRVVQQMDEQNKKDDAEAEADADQQHENALELKGASTKE